MKLKGLKVLLVVCVIGVIMCGAEAFAQDIKINVNGEVIATDVAPILENDRVLVPVRAIAEALKCDVSWKEENRAVSVFDGASLAVMWLDRDTAFKTNGVTINGHCKMDVTPKTVNDRTMIPVRAISELLGAEVDWVNKENTVTISYEVRGYDIEDGTIERLNPVYINGFTKMYDTYCDYVYDRSATTSAEIELSDGKLIKLKLYNDIAPKSVENFVNLAKSGAYDGKVFHRVIKDFMIQGGGYDEKGTESESPTIVGEFLANGYLNLIEHKRGVISMARTNDMNSASNQFFIMHKDMPNIDGIYAAFGYVTEGIEYIDEIAAVNTDAQYKPTVDQVIKTVRIL